MEIVTGDPAPRQEPEVVRDTLLELAAVIRTIFRAPAPVTQGPVTQAPVAPAQELAPPAPIIPTPASLEVPDLPQPPAAPPAVTTAVPAALPVPQIPVPDLASTDPNEPHDDPEAERHSLALLQEIAFLDD